MDFTKQSINNPTPEQLIQSSPSLTEFVRKVYRTTGLTIGGSLAAGYLLSGTPLAFTNPGLFLIGGFVTSIVGILGFGRAPQVLVQEKLPNGQIREYTENSMSRKLFFSAIIGGTSATLVPLIAMMNAFSPTIIPAAALMSTLIMGGSSLYALRQPQGTFSSWQAGLYGGLLGIIGMNLISLLTFAMIGPNMFTLLCGRLDTYLGIGLFTAFQIFDTQKAIDDFQRGEYDHLNHVVSFYLNFVNIFTRLAIYIREIFYNDQ